MLSIWKVFPNWNLTSFLQCPVLLKGPGTYCGYHVFELDFDGNAKHSQTQNSFFQTILLIYILVYIKISDSPVFYFQFFTVIPTILSDELEETVNHQMWTLGVGAVQGIQVRRGCAYTSHSTQISNVDCIRGSGTQYTAEIDCGVEEGYFTVAR